jgi:hypothetical protein
VLTVGMLLAGAALVIVFGWSAAAIMEWMQTP